MSEGKALGHEHGLPTTPEELAAAAATTDYCYGVVGSGLAMCAIIDNYNLGPMFPQEYFRIYKYLAYNVIGAPTSKVYDHPNRKIAFKGDCQIFTRAHPTGAPGTFTLDVWQLKDASGLIWTYFKAVVTDTATGTVVVNAPQGIFAGFLPVDLAA